MIWGAEAEGAQYAEFMRKRGKDIVLVAEDGDVGGLIPPVQRTYRAIGSIAQVRVVRDATVAGIWQTRALLRFLAGEKSLVPCDSMMVMLPEQRDPAFSTWPRRSSTRCNEIGSTLGGENAFLKRTFADDADWLSSVSIIPCPVVLNAARLGGDTECMKGTRSDANRGSDCRASRFPVQDGPLFVSECNLKKVNKEERTMSVKTFIVAVIHICAAL